MKRLFCLFALLVPLAGCAGFDDFTVFSEQEPSPCAARPVPVRACGDGVIAQTGASLPAQTAEPPR